jgi:hypothetical protein
MTCDDFLHFICAVAVALEIVFAGLVFMLPDKKKCDKCIHHTKNGCRIMVNRAEIKNTNINEQCGFYKEKGE